MSDEQPEQAAWEDRCRDCDNTGVTIQTERRCACQPPFQVEQPEPWARDWRTVAELAQDYEDPRLNMAVSALHGSIQRTFAEREEHARAERRNIISHATMGSTTGEGMSVNDVCVEITRQRNKLYQAGKNSAEAELVGASNRTLEDHGRMLWRDDVEGHCASPDMCFEYGDTVRCSPCAIKQSAAAGVQVRNPDGSYSPEVCRLKRENARLQENANG